MDGRAKKHEENVGKYLWGSASILNAEEHQ